MPCEILQVDDVAAAFPGRGDCRHAEQMRDNVGVETEGNDVTFNELVPGTPSVPGTPY